MSGEHNELEEYYCPDCGKEFRVRANNTPHVTKVSSRTDGRDIKYDDFIKQNKKESLILNESSGDPLPRAFVHNFLSPHQSLDYKTPS